MGKTMFCAVVRPDGDGGYWAEFPDLPGCYGQGRTVIECVGSASDGLETHLAAMEADGLPVPAASEAVECDGMAVWVYADTSAAGLGAPSVTSAEAARRLGVTPARVSQLVADGRLDARRAGGMTLVTEESVEAYARTPRAAGRPRKGAASA